LQETDDERADGPREESDFFVGLVGFVILSLLSGLALYVAASAVLLLAGL
jgi:hypothetical protein